MTCLFLIGTLYDVHRENPAFALDALQHVLEEWEPDIVGVEVRPEDLTLPESDLKKFYSEEMVWAAVRYRDRVARAIDWRGDEGAGKPSLELLEGGEGKAIARQADLEARLQHDHAMQGALDLPRKWQVHKEAAKRTQSGEKLNGEDYDRFARAYRQAFAKAVSGTDYAWLAEFQTERIQRQVAAIAELVRASPGLRLAALVGLDHRGSVAQALRQEFFEGELAFAEWPDSR
ncbi:MAG: hypothetical protein ABSF50_21850 [Burkholderiaceae bacterium]|jgi:hypothetical protein